jgi:hypothetical protein
MLTEKYKVDPKSVAFIVLVGNMLTLLFVSIGLKLGYWVIGVNSIQGMLLQKIYTSILTSVYRQKIESNFIPDKTKLEIIIKLIFVDKLIADRSEFLEYKEDTK